MKTIQTFRKDFPIFEANKELIYLDTAATAQKPKVVLDAMADFYANHYGTVHRGIYSLSVAATEAYEAARRKVQKFINAAYLEEIIFTRGTTASLNLVARSFGEAFLNPGDEILLTEVEHHSNLVPWQMLRDRKGIVLRFIPVNDQGELLLKEFQTILTPRVKLISLPYVSNVLGTINPVEKIVERAHEMGAYVCVDGAQAAPHLPIDIQRLDADFYCFSGHKLYGPTGIGVLYGKKKLLQKLPPIDGGGDMIESVTLEKTVYQNPPLRFEAGTPPIVEAVGLGHAIDYLSQIGIYAIRERENELLTYATTQLSDVPRLKIIGSSPSKAAIITFTLEGLHPLDLGTLLDCQNIAIRTGHLCSQPTMTRFGISTASRLSFGIYNSFLEIDLFIKHLKSLF